VVVAGCWAEVGAVPLNLVDAQGDEAEASCERTDLRHLEVLGEVRDGTIFGGGAGDAEGEKQHEVLAGTAGPHELLAQRRRQGRNPGSSFDSSLEGVGSIEEE
jgi:hypothetical protein